MSNRPRKTEEGSKTVQLPPSGLAEDILRGSSAEEQQQHHGPDQIYAFADSLKASERDEDTRAREARMETWVTFSLGAESFGLPVSHVQEILRVAAITRVPHAPKSIRGVTNMRGRVLPVVDLRVRLGLPETDLTAHNRILVASSRGRQIGLLVDAVQQVTRIDIEAVQPPPPDVMTKQSDYIKGVYNVQDGLIIMLLVDRVLLIHDALQGNLTQDQD